MYESTEKPQLARDTYDELLKAAGASAWQAEARARREALLQKHPELAATNAPVTVATNATAGQLNSAATNQATNADAVLADA